MRNKRILLAESGATKTEWRLCEQGQVVGRFSSMGLNPSTLSHQDIRQELLHVFANERLILSPDSLYFFGAGLRNENPRKQMKMFLAETFPAAKQVWVGDDLQAACLATQRSKGIVAILGTGSNACEFEQGKITQRRGGLGYILGDEGSGSDLGKHLISGILKGDFDRTTETVLLESLQMNREQLRNHLYSQSNPAKWLASLAQVVHQFKHNSQIHSLIANRFETFITQTLLPLSYSRNYPIDFIGSIAIHFQQELREALTQQNLSPGKFVPDPIEKLIEVLSNDDSTFTIG